MGFKISQSHNSLPIYRKIKEGANHLHTLDYSFNNRATNYAEQIHIYEKELEAVELLEAELKVKMSWMQEDLNNMKRHLDTAITDVHHQMKAKEAKPHHTHLKTALHQLTEFRDHIQRFDRKLYKAIKGRSFWGRIILR